MDIRGERVFQETEFRKGKSVQLDENGREHFNQYYLILF
jgi:hypothetical protein